MKNIVFALSIATAFCSNIFAQNQNPFEFYFNVGLNSSNAKTVGTKNNTYATNSSFFDFVSDVIVWDLTDGASSIISETGEADWVTEQRITDSRNFTTGVLLTPCQDCGVQFGVGFSFQKYTLNKTWQSGYTNKETERFLTIMPEIRGNWVSKEKWSIYSGASAGITKRTYKAAKKERYRNRYELDYQINLVGVKVNNGPVSGHLGLGYGAQGVVQGGVSVRL